MLPKALRKGDEIAFISPSSRLNITHRLPLERAKTHFEKLGYIVRVIFTDVLKASYHDAVRQRCEEIHLAFRTPSIKAILCTVGGLSANELLPHLDYDLIRANPKIFGGYSDITVLHYAIFTQTGLQTFYSPAAISEFGVSPAPMQFTTDHFLSVLHGSENSIGLLPRSVEWAPALPDFFLDDPASEKPQSLCPSPSWEWLRPGKATGRLVGGCINPMLHLAGTKYWPDHQGRIFFFETSMGNALTDPYPLWKLQSQLADLVNIGIFKEISGLVVGRPVGDDEKMRRNFARIVLEQCAGTTFPILMNVDVGHSAPNLTLPLNALASLDSEKDEFRILDRSVVV